MSDILDRLQELAAREEVRISEHGYDELAEDGLSARDVVGGLAQAALVEEYSDYPKGPCVLVLQRTPSGKPVHAVWGIPKGASTPAVLVTAYRPDPSRWSDDFMRRQ